MFFKLALRNVRRSARDYAIYFATVTIGVAMFYAFNALESQAVLFDALATDDGRMFSLLNMMIKLFSIVVACVLGFLVVYANRFLIRRRKREFGTYLMLGMGPARVSRILLYETALVGLVSLVLGLLIGIVTSQGLSFATAALMGTTMKKYQFIVSADAIGLTILCFVIVFAVSALIDIIYIRRCKLVSLLSIHEANESAGRFNVPARVVGFVASLVILACAYWQLMLNGMIEPDEHFYLATVLMIIGTFLFFWSIAGFMIMLLQRIKGVYFKDICMFTVRQISSKVNTAFVSISVVSILLFFALTVSSVGMGLVQLFVGNIEKATAYDVTLMAYPELTQSNSDQFLEENEDYADSVLLFNEHEGDMAQAIQARGGNWDSLVKDYAQIDFYDLDQTYDKLFNATPNIDELVSEMYQDSATRMHISVMSVSQYNKLCELYGTKGITLAEDECAVNNTVDSTQALAQAWCESALQVTLEGKAFHFTHEPLSTPTCTSAMIGDVLQIIVPDSLIDSLGKVPTRSDLNLMYTSDRETGDLAFARYFAKAFPVDPESLESDAEVDLETTYTLQPWPAFAVYTGYEMANQASGLRMIITYLALYIGFVLLVATAAILAVQQLSETADSLSRYKRLATLGCSDKSIIRSLRTQTCMYFVAPLFLAVCHTACAIWVIGNDLFAELGVNIGASVLGSIALVLAIYALYLLVTYALSRSIVKNVIE